MSGKKRRHRTDTQNLSRAFCGQMKRWTRNEESKRVMERVGTSPDHALERGDPHTCTRTHTHAHTMQE